MITMSLNLLAPFKFFPDFLSPTLGLVGSSKLRVDLSGDK